MELAPPDRRKSCSCRELRRGPAGRWGRAGRACEADPYLKVPERDLTLVLAANGEGLCWGKPLDEGSVEGSPFARAFLDPFVFGAQSGDE